MTDIYLVIEVAGEGIDTIYRGFLDPDQALVYYKRLVEEKNKEAEAAEDEWDRKFILDSVKRLCIQKGSEKEEFDCVCRQLGLEHEEPILY